MDEREVVHLEVEGGVGRITLDSPENRNALSRRLQSELRGQLEAALGNEHVRVIVLTATGTVFCSGADLREQRAANESGGAGTGPGLTGEIIAMMAEAPKPVVGRINGHARAGGLGLIAACDIAVAADTATFATSEVRIGVIPAVISAVLLPKVGVAAASELFLTGEPWTAERAVRAGLINEAVPESELDREVTGWVASLLKGGPLALAGTKELIRSWIHAPSSPDELTALSARYFASPEALDGMTAFTEKRQPRWIHDG